MKTLKRDIIFRKTLLELFTIFFPEYEHGNTSIFRLEGCAHTSAFYVQIGESGILVCSGKHCYCRIEKRTKNQYQPTI